MGIDNYEKNEDYNIYSILRDDIVSLRLKPGMFFSIKDICEIYQVGRSPGRDALIRLEQEGLITFRPQRGTMVSKLNLTRIENERFIRKAIEEKVLGDFIGLFSPTVILQLENFVMEQKQYFNSRDVRHFLDADDKFHAVFFAETGREYCASVIEKECGNYKRLRLLTLMLDESTISNTIDEHEAMISAISTRDLDRLMNCFDLHLNRIRPQERRLLKEFPDLFDHEDQDGAQKRIESSGLQHDFLLSIRSRGL